MLGVIPQDRLPDSGITEKLGNGAAFVVELGHIGDEEIGLAGVMETGVRRTKWRRKMKRMGATVANVRVDPGSSVEESGMFGQSSGQRTKV